MAATGERNDPFRAFNFEVNIDNVALAGFSEVSGLTAEGDAVEYREGTDPRNTVRKLVGLRKFANVTLKRGYTRTNDLWAWYTETLEGRPNRRNVTIKLKDENRRDVMAWHLDAAWINKIEGASLKASGNEVAMESVEIVHEGVTIELLG